MKFRRPLSWMLAFCLLALTFMTTLAQEPVPEQDETSGGGVSLLGVEGGATIDAILGQTWKNDVVESTDMVGAYSSLAIGPDGGMHVSYYDETHGDLRYAKYLGDGSGNCGPNDNWHCITVDDGAGHDVGKYSSIAVHPTTGWPAIAYFDDTSNDLKYAAYICFIGCGWFDTVIDDGGIMTAGLHTSIKFTGNGDPVIAYQRTHHVLADRLMVAYYVGGTGGTCTYNSWNCDLVDEGVGRGQGISLETTGSSGKYIAYYDANAGNLLYAWQVNPGSGNCLANNSWKCYTIDSAGDVGRFPSLNYDAGGNKIAYYDATNGKLKLAYFVDSGSDCGGGLPMKCISMDTIGTGLTVGGIGLTAVGEDAPVIAYYDSDLQSGSLKVAYPRAFGNCGPIYGSPPITWRIWQCDTLDTGFWKLGYNTVGLYASADANSAGLVSIAYFNETLDNLEVMYELMGNYLPLLVR
ncbi:MAG: hypothetical protein JW862_16840 [Anaerolineales bacterium]|nr:hypothetical protein [Anaerolineales bacterium]